MKIAALAILALGQVTMGLDDFSIGVAAADAREHCLALPGPALDAGSSVALITPTQPQRVYRATVVRTTASCTILSKHDVPGPYYVLALEAAAESPPDLAVAVKGRPDVRVARGQVRLRLTDTLREVRVRSCASSEGLHLTVWSGTPLRSTRLWHAYWYLGFDVEPDCRPRDYRDGGQQAAAPDETGARSRAPVARGAIVDARVPQVSGTALGAFCTFNMDGIYEPDLYDLVTPETFGGDVEWYRRKARECGGPVLELGAGTGRVTLALALDGVQVYALDADRSMLAALRRKVADAPTEVPDRVVAVEEDMRTFRLEARFALIIAPFRAILHNLTEDDQLACFQRVREHLRPGGHFAFNVFHPSLEYMAQHSGALAGVCSPSTGALVPLSFGYPASPGASRVSRG